MPRAVTAARCDRSLGARRGERVVQGFGSDLDPLWHREHDLALVVQEPFRVDDRYADQLASGIEAKVMTLGRPVEIDRLLRVRAVEVEHVALWVVADAVEVEVADRHGHGF